MCLIYLQSISSLHLGHDVVLAGDSSLQHTDSSAGEVGGEGQVPAEHVTLTVQTPAPAAAQYIELQDVSFAIELQALFCLIFIKDLQCRDYAMTLLQSGTMWTQHVLFLQSACLLPCLLAYHRCDLASRMHSLLPD